MPRTHFMAWGRGVNGQLSILDADGQVEAHNPQHIHKVGSDEEGRENFPLHHPQFDFNDKIIPIGSGVFVRLVEQLQPCRV